MDMRSSETEPDADGETQPTREEPPVDGQELDTPRERGSDDLLSDEVSERLALEGELPRNPGEDE